MAAKTTPEDINWNDYFEYANGELFWKVSTAIRIKVGDKAGRVCSKGSVQIRLKGEYYQAHRIIWEMHNGPLKADELLDHINRIKLDNRIENLRIVSQGENIRNQGERGLCKKGVHFDPRRYKNPFRASICLDGKTVHIGNFADEETAHEAYCLVYE